MLMKKLSTNFKQKSKASSEYIQDNLPLTLNHFLIGCSSTSDGLLNVSEKVSILAPNGKQYKP